MIIKTLVENTAIAEQFTGEHGLSLYIETKKHKLLFDLGATDLFLRNAQKMGVNIAEVDLVVISHGHYDHGGGLPTFLQENSQAKIYLHEKAFEKHYSKRPNGNVAEIGLLEELKENDRIELVGDFLRIDEELTLFSNVKAREFYSLSNRTLLMQVGEEMVEDTFAHEQNLIINENGKKVLIAGCAHNGIVNIVKRLNELQDKPADYVIGGFHLTNPGLGTNEEPALINAIGAYLNTTESLYYTCHCTGLEPFRQLKEVMKDKIQYLATGTVLNL